MTKFSLEKIIYSDRESVFEIFSNYRNYEKILPQHFPSIRIRSIRNNTSIVEEHLNFGSKEFIIMAKHVLQNPTMHDIFVVGGNIKGSYFKEEFIEISGYTKVIVDVKIKFGKLNIQNLYTNKYRKYYECILDDFAKICEN